MDFIKKNWHYLLIVLPGIFLEYLVFTISWILSYDNILFNPIIIWQRLIILVLSGNLVLFCLVFVISKLLNRLLHREFKLFILLFSIWLSTIFVILFLNMSNKTI